jgi:hypothetical protein
MLNRAKYPLRRFSSYLRAYGLQHEPQPGVREPQDYPPNVYYMTNSSPLNYAVLGI